MVTNPEAVFQQLKALVASMPNLRSVTDTSSTPAATQEWLGRVHAVLENGGYSREAMEWRVDARALVQSRGMRGRDELQTILYRALADAEQRAPAAAQGSFIPAGSEFLAFATLGKVLAVSARDVLIVDPYMDEIALTDFALCAGEGVSIRLLADEARVKPTLAPAATRWQRQYGVARPLAVRFAGAKTLHDRLILVDHTAAWLLTQSLKDFAKRAHGSIALADAEASALKVDAYERLWDNATSVM